MALSAAGFDEARGALDAALSGGARAAILDELLRAKSFDRSARRLRDALRAHRFEAGEAGLELDFRRFVKRGDDLGRADGFHLLHDWDGKTDRFNDESIPAEVAGFVERVLAPETREGARHALGVLLDYYFLHLLGLLALRAWDQGSGPEADRRFAAIDALLGLLQGPCGSGHVFARSAGTLVVIATSHFEPDITAYDRLLARLATRSRARRLDFARMHAAVMGSHLRFGLEVTCVGRVPLLRDDNVPDYPWLCEALATLLEGYDDAVAAGERASQAALAEPILVGLIPDPAAFLETPPPALAAVEDRRGRLASLFEKHRGTLRRDFESHRPSPERYSPFHFTFNFPHNLVKGAVVDAAIRNRAWRVALDDLVTATVDERTPSSLDERRELATTLMRYALASPDTINGKPHPAVVYHPAEGLRAFDAISARLG